ncbi:MAG: hypothetical protein ABIO02_00575 [Patescibacteria group bacterium]
MKILITHANNFDFVDELYNPLRKSQLNQDHDFILPHESDVFIVTKPLLKNKEVQMVIAEVSNASTGEGIELGWADVFSVPVICIYKKGTNYSKSLNAITNIFIEYENSDDMIAKIDMYIKSL